MIKAVILIGLITTIISCGTSEKNSAPPYRETVSSHTMSNEKYKGFNNLYQIHATMLSTEVASAKLVKKAKSLQWPTSQLQVEKTKLFQDIQINSRFFIGYFTPNKDLGNLHRKRALSKFYLYTGERKFEGTVKKVDDKKTLLKSIYPHIKRWHKAYEVSFAVPMATVEKQGATLVFTGTAGKTELNFTGK